MIVASWSDLRLYDGSDFKTYLLMRGLGPDVMSFGQPHHRLTVGFILLRYSVVCPVESLCLVLSPFYILICMY